MSCARHAWLGRSASGCSLLPNWAKNKDTIERSKFGVIDLNRVSMGPFSNIRGRLSPTDQALIWQAAKDSIPVNRELRAAREELSEEKVRAAGVQVIDTIDKTAFIEAMVPVYVKHASPPRRQDLVTEIQATE